MIPVRDSLFAKFTPILTWTLIGLNVLIYLWDRNWAWLGPSVVFADLALVPTEIVRAFTSSGDKAEFGKTVTSMFLHADLAHLVANLLFLYAFGPSVERVLGGFRFALYYLFWGILASGAHVFVNSASSTPTLGASGAIGGVLGAYFLLFPGNRIQVILPPFVFWLFAVPAWVLLGVWFLFQILFPQMGVANWAHAGGFMAGMVTVLVMGGRQQVLKGIRFDAKGGLVEDVEDLL
jgi:membrane associated rhomboid family serine protease